jgi:hypothetical protein
MFLGGSFNAAAFHFVLFYLMATVGLTLVDDLSSIGREEEKG